MTDRRSAGHLPLLWRGDSENSAENLQHIRGAIGFIEESTSGGREKFFRQKLIRDAVIRKLEVIGEAVKNIPDELRLRCPSVPWQRVLKQDVGRLLDELGR